MYVGKVIPLHVGSASRVLLAWSPDLAEKVLAGPLQPMTDGTVTRPDALRRLIAQAKADGYAITAGEREDSDFRHRYSMPQATSLGRSRSAGRRCACPRSSARD
jgi:hypothetical protein